MHIGVTELILILVIVVVVFGAAKFPAMMKNLASGVKEFKKEIKSDEQKKPAKQKKTKKK